MGTNLPPDATPPNGETPGAPTSSSAVISTDQPPHISSSSETESHHHDEFIATSNQLTNDYVTSNLAAPSKNLSSADARFQFVSAVLGDVTLGKFAESDRALLHQLESRLTIIVDKATPRIEPPSHHVDVDTLIAVLVLIAARWPILVDTMERQDVILTVVSAMRTWRNRSALVARCMTALRVFSVNDAARKRVMIDGGLTLTLDLMKQYHDDPRIQMRAAAVIANVAFGCTHRKRRIVREGGVRRVLEGMNRFPEHEQIQLRGALTIRNLTHETQVNQFIAGNEGAVEIISASLIRFRNTGVNPELRFHCVMALESLCKEDEGNRKRIAGIDSGGETLTKSKSWNTEGGFQKWSLNEKNRVNEDGDIIVDEEEVILSQVTGKFKHGEVLLPGRNSKRSDAPTRTRSAVHRNETKTTTKAREGSSESTLERSNEEKRKPSLLKVILHSIRRDPDDELLVETALSLITLISLQRENIQVRIGEVGGIQIAIASMRRHSKHAGIISKASALLRGLCVLDVNRGQVTSGLGVLISAIREHKCDGETVCETISALSNAVHEHEKNRSQTVNKGGVEAVMQAMSEAGNEDTMVLEAGICALRNFVAGSESGALSVANDGALGAALDALKKTKEAKTVTQKFIQEQCVYLLGDVAQLSGRAKQEMLELKTIEIMEEILGRPSLKEREPLYVKASEVLSLLVKLRRSIASTASRPSSHSSVARTTSRKTFSRSLLEKIGLNLRPVQITTNGKRIRVSAATDSASSGGGRRRLLRSASAPQTVRVEVYPIPNYDVQGNPDMLITSRPEQNNRKMNPAYITMGAPSPVSRRNALRLAGLALAAVCTRSARPAYALKPGKPSKEKLLNAIHDERTPEEIEAEKERVAEEKRQRLEKQKELQASADRKKAGLEEDTTKETEIESNLRGQYYFPTARKRYLPRVKLAYEAMPNVENAVRESDWSSVKDLSGVLEDATLPLKLYASSLAGGGLNINSKFIAGMNTQAANYENAIGKMKIGVKKKDSKTVLTSLNNMKGAIDKYRQLGRLDSPDFGIGEIQADKKVGSGFSNNNSALYARNKAVQVIKSTETSEPPSQ